MFDRCVVLNLDRRPDRWAAFLARIPADWPFPAPERWPAVDGEQAVGIPSWWRESPGAWGCFQSHLAIWRAQQDAGERWLILEDDAFAVDNLAERWAKIAENVPGNWHQMYLGGQFLELCRVTPQPFDGNPWWVRAFNVNRTHAYAVAQEFLPRLLKFFEKRWNLHVDYALAKLHRDSTCMIVAPREWLFGQVAGRSDVCVQGETNRAALAKTMLWQLPELKE